jgi:hypothetical protein
MFFPSKACSKYRQKLDEYSYLKLEMRNPNLNTDKELREILIKKRNCHKIFDRINCGTFEKILE